MAHSVTVHQITSESGHAFMNVDDKEGHIGVWTTTYNQPVYLLQNGINVYLIVFDNEAWAKEWIDEHEYRFSNITRLVETETKPQSA